METIDCVVVGAGVVGLAIARELAARGFETLVVEKNATHGMEISSRNSEVVHSGIYYAPGSLKAQTCVRGRQLLYEYCTSRGVRFDRCGKLIVATSIGQMPRLKAILQAARDNGVSDVRLINAREAMALEPEIRCVAALLCPSTGIVDSHELMTALLGDAESHGAVLSCHSPVRSIRPTADGCEIHVEGAGSDVLRARIVVNAAGLGAVGLARCVDGLPADRVPGAWLAKGSYFSLAGRAPFSRLVYPVPEPGGLGIHLTLDLGGQARFGPDVEWVDQIDYDVDPARAERFRTAISTYWPGVTNRILQPAYAGIRPKIAGPDEPAADFRIDGPGAHGVPGLINLFGIESPGLTASLAIAEHVLAGLRQA